MPLSAGTSLGRYKIISPLGAGGMGEVYRAEDTLLNRQVAIKVLPSHLSDNSEALKRFQKEAKALAALSHSNILTIHDFVSDNGLSFVVMELLEGETLRARLSTSQLSWQQAVEIAIQIGDGLAAAHSKGVVHRDLKPENILFTSNDSVKIVDFGLARLQPANAGGDLSEVETASKMTETGIVRGTVPYMSPEQVRGEHVDSRSDIFSFGCILYEMLSGKRAFSGKSSAETAASILRDEPKKLNGVPAELERILKHCLEKRPERRLHSAHDLAIELKDLSVSNTKIYPLPSRPRNKAAIIAVIVILAALLSAVVFRQKFNVSSNVEKIQSLAVLPLKNLSNDPDQEFFADGMTEELIARLARISALRVISRTSIMEYKGMHKKTLPQIAKELNVDAIVEGSVMQSGNRVRITAQLISAATDKHLWSESYERDLNDILGLQNEVASAVADEIRVKLTPQEEAQFAETLYVKPEAYQAYLRGINYTNRPHPSEEDLRLGITMFERAIEIDPNFAKAYTSLSMAHSRMYFSPYDPSSERLAKAKAAVNHAFALKPVIPEAHIALGYYYYWGFMKYEPAVEEFSTAQKIIPNDSGLIVGLSSIRKRQGDFQAALKGNQRALELDPRNAAAALEVGIIYSLIPQYAEAQRYFDLSISIAPDAPGAYTYKIENFLKWKGDTKAARTLIVKIPDEEERNEYFRLIEWLDRNYQSALDFLPLRSQKGYLNSIQAGWCYRLMNRTDKARASFDAARIELEHILENSSEKAELHSRIAIAYAGLNRKEEAIREAKTAIEILPVSKDAVTGPAMVRNLAVVYTMLGEFDAALNWIEYLLSNGTGVSILSVQMLNIDPVWDPLRSHPRFQKILDKYRTRS